MPSGLAALLDDIATITKLAAASVDDIGAAAGRAGVKAAGVVVDDTAVTPRYLIGFTPARELPIIWRIAKGSLRNKLLFILPVALALSALAPWAITPLLMIGGAYLCFEGAEKLLHALRPHHETLAEDAAELTSEEHEAQMVAGAVRTDFILSAEIMAIALAEVADMSFGLRAAALAIVALAITVAVYGVVGLIVKMDDIGLHLAKQASSASQAIGRAMVRVMPKLLAALSVIGTAAMLWVGGQIVLHGLEEFGLGALPHWVHHVAEVAGHAVPAASGVIEWTVAAALSGVFGALLGGVIVWLHGLWVKARGGTSAGSEAAH